MKVLNKSQYKDGFIQALKFRKQVNQGRALRMIQAGTFDETTQRNLIDSPSNEKIKIINKVSNLINQDLQELQESNQNSGS